jgi:hypothetical protein
MPAVERKHHFGLATPLIQEDILNLTDEKTCNPASTREKITLAMEPLDYKRHLWPREGYPSPIEINCPA